MKRTAILNIFSDLKPGYAYPVEDILERVEMSGLLTAEDFEPHTRSRKTNYPRWKDQVQSVLYDLKMQQKVIHDEVNHRYTFVG